MRDISFESRRGETLCLVGESGCGKSMTALALMGLLPRRQRASAATPLFEGGDLASAARVGGNCAATAWR